MSKRQSIMDKLMIMLQDIWQVNGYNTDIGNNVQEWRVTPVAEGDLPMLTYSDISHETSVPLSVRHDHVLTVKIEAYVAAGTATAATARLVMSDILRAVGKNRSFDRLVIKASPSSGTLEIEQQNKLIGRVTLNLVLTYASAEWEI